jgi:glycosyltransferase involved in cell wall biosynthesis
MTEPFAASVPADGRLPRPHTRPTAPLVEPAGGDARPVAISLTPLPLEADSRAFRIASSLADAGFRSILVEGRASRDRFWGRAIEVRSIEAATAESSRAPRGGVLRDGRLGSIGELALYAAFRAHDWWYHCRRPAAIMPRGDLYYLHSFELHRAVAARAGPAAPIIYDAHDFYRGIDPPDRQLSFDRHHLRPFLNRLEDRLAATAAALVTVSDGVADLMERAFKRRPTVIRNCHDERLDQPIESDLRARLGLSSADRLCVVVGNRKPGMAIDVAAEALALLPERFHLAFLGRGYDSDREWIRTKPIAARIHFGHHVPPSQVVPFIRSADAGLVIYRHYSENYRCALPNGFFQIVAAGLPLVRAALPEIEAAIGSRAVGVCLGQLDAPSLATAILHCTADGPTLRSASAMLGQELRWEREARCLQGVIADVLRGRAPVPQFAGASLEQDHAGLSSAGQHTDASGNGSDKAGQFVKPDIRDTILHDRSPYA